jgi:hypothetical protein
VWGAVRDTVSPPTDLDDTEFLVTIVATKSLVFREQEQLTPCSHLATYLGNASNSILPVPGYATKPWKALVTTGVSMYRALWQLLPIYAILTR